MAQYEYITLNGTIIPDTAITRSEVITEYQAQFGTDLNTSSNTPQGILINSDTLARNAVIVNNATLANQINPNEAGGIFLDAIGLLTGSTRNAEEFTTIDGVLLTGVPGTIIPAQTSQAQTTNGDVFQLISVVVLDALGNGVGTFQALIAGAINAPANSLTTIVNGGVLGWETVNNPNAGVEGQVTQNDEVFRTFRNRTLAAQGRSLPEAIISNLNLLPGVRSVAFRENISGMTQVIDGVTMVGHSIYVCVDGGTDNDIANTLNRQKTAGASYNGNVSVTVTDQFSGQTTNVLFDRPTLIDIFVQVTIKQNFAVADPVAVVIAAILAYENGLLNNEQGLTVGTSVSPFELSGAINVFSPGIFVSLVQISLDGITYTTNVIPIEIFQKASIVADNIQVIVS